MINVNLIYPIGSIYISTNSKNPSEIFGGTWERIKGKMLIGVDEDDDDFNTSGKTGGEKEHTLTVDEMPSHTHSAKYLAGATTGTSRYIVDASGTGSASVNNYTGGDQAHNNMPPFYTVYIFVRTA